MGVPRVIYVPQLPQYHGVNGKPPWPQSPPRKVWNRSGSATVAGKIYKCDLRHTITQVEDKSVGGYILSAVTNWNVGGHRKEPGSAFNNIIATPDIASEVTEGRYVVALQPVADNEECDVLDYGVVTLMGVYSGAFTDDGTIIIPKHSLIVPKQNSVDAALANQTGGDASVLDGTTLPGGSGYVGKLIAVTLEAKTVIVVGDDYSPPDIQVFFNGEGMIP